MKDNQDQQLHQEVQGAMYSAFSQTGPATVNIYPLPKPWVPPLSKPRRVQPFVGREAELARLLVDLQPGHVVTICGPGGIGKTALAAEVIWTLAPGNIPPSVFPDGIFFYSFYGQPDVTLMFEELARSFGEGPTKLPAQHAAQIAVQRHSRALLVFDGTEEASNLGQVLQMLRVCGNTAVLMTSQRRSDAALQPAFCIDLPKLTINEAVTLLQGIGGEKAKDSESSIEICELIGRLPLAIDLIGRYLQAQQEETSKYLTWLQKNLLPALDPYTPDRGLSRFDSVPRLLEHSIEKLGQASQQALVVIGLLSTTPFSREIIPAVLQFSEEVAHQAYQDLVDYGLLIRDEQGYEVSHSLVHAYARSEALPFKQPLNRQEVLDRVVVVLSHFLQQETEVVKENLLPHIQVCAEHIATSNVLSPESKDFLVLAGLACFNAGLYRKAESLWLKVLKIDEEQLGAEHPDTTIILNNLAEVYRVQARYIEAEALHQKVLSIKQKQLGTTLQSITTTVNNLAVLYQEQGKYAKAEPWLKNALQLTEMLVGLEDPRAARCMNNLAMLYSRQDKHAEAEALLQEALKIAEAQLGAEHLERSLLLNNLATQYMHQSKYPEAEALLQEALKIAEAQLGAEHPKTEEIRSNLAVVYQEQSKYAEAEPLLRNTLKAAEEQLGMEHPKTALSMNNLAVLYRKQGKYAEAEALLQKALKITEAQLGAEHLEVATYLSNLGILYQEQGKYAEAETLLQKALKITEAQLGLEHLYTIRRLNALITLYQQQKKYAEAVLLMHKGLKITEDLLGEEHPDTVTYLSNLGDLYTIQGQYSEAELLYRRALNIAEKHLGEEHQITGELLDALGIIYREGGKYVEAETSTKRSLNIAEKQSEVEYPYIAKRSNDLGLIFRLQGKYAEAESLISRALAITEKQLGEESLEVATYLGNLGIIYLDQGKYAEAESLISRALAITEKQLGEEHQIVGILLDNLGSIYLNQKKYTEAEVVYKRSVVLIEKQFGMEDIHTAKSLSNLAMLYVEQGKYEKAESLMLEVLKIVGERLKEHHPEMGKFLNILALIYQKQEKYVEAEDLMQKALIIAKEQLGMEHPDTLRFLSNWSNLRLVNMTVAALGTNKGQKAFLRASLLRMKGEVTDVIEPSYIEFINALVSLLDTDGQVIELGESLEEEYAQLWSDIVRRIIRTEDMNELILNRIVNNTLLVYCYLNDEMKSWLATLLQIQEQLNKEENADIIVFIDSVISLLRSEEKAKELGEKFKGIYAQKWQDIIIKLDEMILLRRIVYNTLIVIGSSRIQTGDWLEELLRLKKRKQRDDWLEELLQLKQQISASDKLNFITFLNAIVALLDADGEAVGLGEGLSGIYAQAWQAIVDQLGELRLLRHIIYETLVVLVLVRERKESWRAHLLEMGDLPGKSKVPGLIALLDAVVALLNADGEVSGLGEGLSGIYAQTWQEIVSQLAELKLLQRLVHNTLAVFGPAKEQRNVWLAELLQWKKQISDSKMLGLIALLDAVVALLNADGEVSGLGEGLPGIYAQTWQEIVSQLT